MKNQKYYDVANKYLEQIKKFDSINVNVEPVVDENGLPDGKAYSYTVSWKDNFLNVYTIECSKYHSISIFYHDENLGHASIDVGKFKDHIVCTKHCDYYQKNYTPDQIDFDLTDIFMKYRNYQSIKARLNNDTEALNKVDAYINMFSFPNLLFDEDSGIDNIIYGSSFIEKIPIKDYIDIYCKKIYGKNTPVNSDIIKLDTPDIKEYIYDELKFNLVRDCYIPDNQNDFVYWFNDSSYRSKF